MIDRTLRSVDDPGVPASDRTTSVAEPAFEAAVELGGRLALQPMGARVAALYEITTVATLLAGTWGSWTAASLSAIALSVVHGVVLYVVCRRSRQTVATLASLALLLAAVAAVVSAGTELGWHSVQLVLAVLVSGSTVGLSLSRGPFWGVAGLVVGGAGWAGLLMWEGQALDPVVALNGVIFTAALGVTVAVMMRRGARLTEDLMAAAERSLTAREVAQARWRARQQDSRTLHDTVLSTLTVLAHGGGGLPSEVVREACVRDSRALSDAPEHPPLRVDDSRSDPGKVISYRTAAWHALQQHWEARGVSVTVFGTPSALAMDEVRPRAADALIAAVNECVANVERHSGATAATVSVQIGALDLHCAVVDEGRGFDLGAVASDRLGIAESVIGRLRDVSGSATVYSKPGDGTTVFLTVPRFPAAVTEPGVT
ncbi:sensor histidine kinase [Lentzea sp. NPDC004789]